VRVALLLNRGETAASTATALALADRLLARGHRVSVFAHDEAAVLAAGNGPVASVVGSLLRRGATGPGFDWIAERPAADALGVGDHQALGVVLGDHADLWALVREADVVLTPGG